MSNFKSFREMLVIDEVFMFPIMLEIYLLRPIY
jgi:hypothetical protein